MDDQRLTKRIYDCSVEANVGKGCPRKTYSKQIGNLLKKRQYKEHENGCSCMTRCMSQCEAREMCQDRGRWRAVISAYPYGRQRKIVTIESPRTPGILPKTGDIVTAKVTVVNSRVVQCVILCVGSSVLVRTYRGIIKKEEIRTTEKDKIDPYKCFRPGDIILARVLPMMEVHWYQLSTAENELGVVIATAEGAPQGINMVPISWSEMQCPKSLVKEPRKVARVLPENIDDATLTEE